VREAAGHDDLCRCGTVSTDVELAEQADGGVELVAVAGHKKDGWQMRLSGVLEVDGLAAVVLDDLQDLRCAHWGRRRF
jgi:hypothetical protein